MVFSGNAGLQLGIHKLGIHKLGIHKLGIHKEEWRSRGYLPHRDKINLLQSITFRLADSLPQNLLIKLKQELEKLPEEKQDLEKRINIEKYLDAGMGCCALKHPRMAETVQKAFLKFDGDKYKLIAWCIMPNHVHILIEPFISLGKIVQSWKSFTGRWAMRYNAELELGVPGGRKLWMREYWDRYIRDEKHLHKVIDYIHNNPVKAGLCAMPECWKWSSAQELDNQRPNQKTRREK